MSPLPHRSAEYEGEGRVRLKELLTHDDCGPAELFPGLLQDRLAHGVTTERGLEHQRRRRSQQYRRRNGGCWRRWRMAAASSSAKFFVQKFEMV